MDIDVEKQTVKKKFPTDFRWPILDVENLSRILSKINSFLVVDDHLNFVHTSSKKIKFVVRNKLTSIMILRYHGIEEKYLEIPSRKKEINNK